MERSEGALSSGVGPVERSLALVGLVLTAPIAGAAAIVVRLVSRGPVLFRAERAGRYGEPFTMLKFRTMHIANGPTGSSITGAKDPRVFAVGRVLRRLKIDEVPQLINIVRGEMAFVGPRPEALDIVAGHYKPWMRETLDIPPGVVGPGSLGYYNEEQDLPDDPGEAARVYVERLLPRKLARELVFVRRRTMSYRLELIARTLLALFGFDGWLRALREREDAAAREILREVESCD